MKEAERTIDTPDDAPEAGADAGTRAGTEPHGDSRAADAPADRSTDDAPTGRGRRRIGVLAAVAVTAYILDLITKIMTVEWLEGRDPIPVIGEWLRFEAVRNSGAAFGMGQALTVVFTCIATVVVIVILRLARKLYSAPWAIALGLLLGGALGNLTDRIFRAPGVFQGAVVDFIAPKHFAVFNLADSAIVCGGILIVLLSFRGLDPDGTVHSDHDDDAKNGAGDDGEGPDDEPLTPVASDTGTTAPAPVPDDTESAPKTGSAEPTTPATEQTAGTGSGADAETDESDGSGGSGESDGSGDGRSGGGPRA